LVLVVAAALHAAPAGAVPLTFHGSRFCYGVGAWYQQVVAGFVVVTPPAGIVVGQLPPDYSVLNVAGVPLFRANDVYYAASPCHSTRSALRDSAAASLRSGNAYNGALMFFSAHKGLVDKGMV